MGVACWPFAVRLAGAEDFDLAYDLPKQNGLPLRNSKQIGQPAIADMDTQTGLYSGCVLGIRAYCCHFLTTTNSAASSPYFARRVCRPC